MSSICWFTPTPPLRQCRASMTARGCEFSLGLPHIGSGDTCTWVVALCIPSCFEAGSWNLELCWNLNSDTRLGSVDPWISSSENCVDPRMCGMAELFKDLASSLLQVCVFHHSSDTNLAKILSVEVKAELEDPGPEETSGA